MPNTIPEQYARRILVAVTGLSPQVVTETLYALSVHRDPPWIPTEIYLVTTAEGARRARLALLSQNPGWFERLRQDYRLPEITFSEQNIQVLTNPQGEPTDDIRTPKENKYAADIITRLMNELTADDQSALHVSIAGGRKTMGYYLGYALSLFGRPQDRLSHVLVSEPFESSWNFFFPTPYSEVIETRSGDLADTRDAEVTLAEIPFVSLRHGLPNELLQGQTSFSDAVSAANENLGPATLTIDLENRHIRCGTHILDLAPVDLAFYSVFARRKLNHQPALAAPPKEAPDPIWAERFLNEYRLIKNATLGDLDRTEKALKNGMDGDYFSTRKSKLHKELKKVLGIAARAYLIDDGGTRPRRYHLNLPAGAIDYTSGKLAKTDMKHTP